jgi:hypothetical protein
MVASTWRKLNIAGYRIVSESEPGKYQDIVPTFLEF